MDEVWIPIPVTQWKEPHRSNEILTQPPIPTIRDQKSGRERVEFWWWDTRLLPVLYPGYSLTVLIPSWWKDTHFFTTFFSRRLKNPPNWILNRRHCFLYLFLLLSTTVWKRGSFYGIGNWPSKLLFLRVEKPVRMDPGPKVVRPDYPSLPCPIRVHGVSERQTSL